MPAPMVNYVLGWDFHHSGHTTRGPNLQNGKCITSGCGTPFQDWQGTFGPIDEADDDWTEPRMNMDVILGATEMQCSAT
jgi:hypothetical protein